MGLDWNKLGGAGAQYAGETNAGIPSDATQLAMMMGFRPNSYASPWQQQQNIAQFMSMQKNIMDQMLGGPGGAAAKMAPGNPMAAMPFGVQNYMNSAAGLLANPMLAPTGTQAATMGPNGYQFGSLPSNMSPLMQSTLQALGQGQSNMQPSPGMLSQLTGPAGQPSGSAGALGAGGNQGSGTGAQGSGSSPITVNTSGSPLPKTAALINQLMGNNSIPQGTDPYNYLDNILSQALQGAQGGQGGGQPQQSGGQQGGGGNPLAWALQHLP